MSKPIEKAEQPFTTTDAELALSLITAGCTLAGVNEEGPAVNLYTPDICRNRWVTKNGSGDPIRVPLLTHQKVTPETFELAVMRAEKARIPGRVTYAFKRDSNFREAIAQHDAIVKEFAEADSQARKPVLPNLAGKSETQAVMIICYARRRNEKDMADLAWVRSPRCAIGEMKKEVEPIEGASGEILEQRSYTAKGGALKVWDLNLPDEKRAQIMGDGKPFLHPKPKL